MDNKNLETLRKFTEGNIVIRGKEGDNIYNIKELLDSNEDILKLLNRDEDVVLTLASKDQGRWVNDLSLVRIFNFLYDHYKRSISEDNKPSTHHKKEVSRLGDEFETNMKFNI